MKYLKIFESWSQDYTYDFTDRGFEVEEEGFNISGKYKGKFIVTELTDEFAEMISKLSINYYILKSKTSFNQINGGASFNVSVSDKFIENGEFISFRFGADNLDFYPKVLIKASTYQVYNYDKQGIIMTLKGWLKSGEEKIINIAIEGNKIKITIRGIARKYQLDLEMATKLFTLIENGTISKNNPYCNYYPQFKTELLKILTK